MLNPIIRLFFIEGNINSQNYCNLLRNQMIPAIQDIARKVFHNVWFQQDETPAHFSLETWNLFNGVFTDELVEKAQ